MLDQTRANPMYTPPTNAFGTPAPVSYDIPMTTGGVPDINKKPIVYGTPPTNAFNPPASGQAGVKNPPPQAPTTPPGGGGQGGLLSDPGYNENWYKKYGDDLMGTPSASENLYAQGVAGSNPFYDYAQQQAIKAINDQSAARGNYNSSFTERNIGSTVADIRGQQAHELGMLAGQADQGKFGRYDRGEVYSRDAQNSLENRAKGSLNAYMDLSEKQGGLVNSFYNEGGRESTAAELEKIQANLKRAGLSQAEYDKWMNLLFEGIGAGSKLGGGK